METTKPLKRINFFHGQVISADDLNAAETYHNRKRALHNQCLHTPGVIPHYLDSLKVDATDDGKHLSIGAGCAIDSEGRELLLPRPTVVEADLREFESEQTIFIVLRYGEQTQLEEHLQRNVNTGYEGYKFIQEYPVLDITAVEPRPADGIELARIKLGKGSAVLRDAADPEHPQENEIDLTYVRWAGSLIGRATLEDIAEPYFESSVGVAVTGSIEQKTQVFFPEKVKLENRLDHYIVDVYPENPGASITWSIAVELSDGLLQYSIYFENFGAKASEVRYKVYRIHSISEKINL